MTELMTVRLKLRQWCAADLEPFASLNADPVVIQFLSRCLTRAESDEFAERVRSELAQRGWGLWAVEVREQGQFIGFVGRRSPPSRPTSRPAHRDRMAPGALELGPRLRHRGRPSVPRFRLPEPRALRGRRLHRARERALAGRDGAARHAPRRGRGLRPSQTAGEAPAPAARALPPEARGLAARLDRPGAAIAGPLRASCIERRAAPTCAPL